MSYCQGIHTHLEELGKQFQVWYDNWLRASGIVHNEMLLISNGVIPSNAAYPEPSYVYTALIADLIEKQSILIEMESHARGLLRAVYQQRMQTLPIPPPTFNLRFRMLSDPSTSQPWRNGMIQFSGQPRMNLVSFGPPRLLQYPLLPTGSCSAPNMTLANTNCELGNSNQTSSSNSTEPRNRSLLRIEKPPERGSSTRSVSEPSRPAEASNFSTITPEIFAAEQFENEASIEESHNTVIIEEVKPDDVLKVEAEWDQIREDAKNDAYVRLEPQKKDASEGTTTFELKNASLNKSDENDIHDEAVNGITKNDEFDNAGHESRMSTATTNTQFYDALSDVEDSGMPEGMDTDYEPSSVLMKSESRPRFGRETDDSAIKYVTTNFDPTPVSTRPSTSLSGVDVSAIKEFKPSSFFERHFETELPKTEKEASTGNPVSSSKIVVPETTESPKISVHVSSKPSVTDDISKWTRDNVAGSFSKPSRFGVPAPLEQSRSSSTVSSRFEDKDHSSFPAKSGGRPRFGQTADDKVRNSSALQSGHLGSRSSSSSQSSQNRTESRDLVADTGMKITFGNTGRTITSGGPSHTSTYTEDRQMLTDSEIALQKEPAIVTSSSKPSNEPMRPSSRGTFGRVQTNGYPSFPTASALPVAPKSHEPSTSKGLPSQNVLGQGDSHGNQVQLPSYALSNYHNGVSLASMPEIHAPVKVYPTIPAAPKPSKSAVIVTDGPLKRLATDDLQLSFEKAGLSKSLVQVLADNGVVKPTELELEIILAFSQGKQMVVKAPPKSGKTFSYACAVVDRISLKPPTFIETVIVTETSTQANSISGIFAFWGTQCAFNYLLCTDHNVQLKSTREIFGAKKAQVAIGTAARLLKVLPENECDYNKVRLMIIDNVREASQEDTDSDDLVKLSNKMGHPKLQQVIVADDFSPIQWGRLTSEGSMDNPSFIEINNVRTF